jgi:hypothetical protein
MARPMTLLSQVSAVLVAAALLSWRSRVRGASFSIGTAAVVAVVAILTFGGLSGFWGAWQGFRNERRANAAIAPADAATRGGAAAGANAEFVEWVNGKVPAGEPVYVSTTGSDEATYQWLLYRLYPRVALQDASKVRWVVFLRTTPAAAGFKRKEFARVEQLAPDLLLAERKG